MFKRQAGRDREARRDLGASTKTELVSKGARRSFVTLRGQYIHCWTQEP